MSTVPAGPADSLRHTAPLDLGAERVALLKEHVPGIAELALGAIVEEVPGYSGALRGRMAENIEEAVQIALRSFLNLAARSGDPSAPLGPALQASYDLGRGEARSGRSLDALLAAYRVGARVSWREMSAVAVAAGIEAPVIARFAELVFAYIDGLSAASVAGHADQLATAIRLEERQRERLALALLHAEAPADLARRAERAKWIPPSTLTAVLLPDAQAHGARPMLDPRTLVAGDELPGFAVEEDIVVMLVPDMGGGARATLARLLTGREAVMGPALPWTQAHLSFGRALRGRTLASAGVQTVGEGAMPYDTDEHLADLVLSADPGALADLQRRALAPLSELPPATAGRLAATLRSWLLHHGRRDAVARDLFVHPQTIRYRMGQVRELFGPALEDPRAILDLTVALGVADGAAVATPNTRSG